MSDNELRKAVHEVLRAIRVEGRHPPTHRRIMAQHRSEWPTLWQALDRLERAATRPSVIDGTSDE